MTRYEELQAQKTIVEHTINTYHHMMDNTMNMDDAMRYASYGITQQQLLENINEELKSLDRRRYTEQNCTITMEIKLGE